MAFGAEVRHSSRDNGERSGCVILVYCTCVQLIALVCIAEWYGCQRLLRATAIYRVTLSPDSQ